MDREFIYRYVITLLMLACVFGGKAQLTLTLERTITLAADSSLDAFRYKNMYLGRLLGIPDLQGRPSAKPYPKSDAGTIPPLFYPTI